MRSFTRWANASPARVTLPRRLGATLLCALLIPHAQAQTTFEDVSVASGVGHSGESYGVSAGDINGDGLLDFFLSNHRESPSLYLNRGGVFLDISPNVRTWVNRSMSDTHGASFSDFDNDGDQDLLVSLGTGNPNQFFVNDFGALIDRTEELGVGFETIGGRLPVWFDYDGDGLLDFVMTQFGGVAKLFRQTATGFVETTTDVGLLCQRFHYGQLFDVDDNGRLDFLCPDDAIFPQKIYDTLPLPWGNLTALFPPVTNVPDTIIADFDNNLRMDMFLISNAQLRPSSVSLVETNIIESHLTGGEKGFNFVTSGNVTFDLEWNKLEDGLGLPRIRIGAIEFNPFEIPFTLDPADPSVAGLPLSDPADAPIMRIGYDDAAQRWTVVAQTEGNFSEGYFTVTADQPITDLQATGLWDGDFEAVPTLLLNESGGLTDATSSALLDIPIQCVSATVGDYDNDMDVDLYLACRTGAENIANIYYDNQGDGTFVAVAGAGGAAGPVGSNVSSGAGTADSVISADYDADGFLDLLITNGFNLRPKEFGGPTKLYRNQGNSNHWVQLDLVATSTPRDAVGARVTAVANSTSQLRVVNGGYHRWSQEPARLHFGLGQADTVDLTIDWPGGLQEVHQDVAVDQIYRVTEGEGLATVVAGAGAPYSCGSPSFDPATDAGVFVWRDCYDDVWRFRFSGGGGANIRYSGRVFSAVPLVQIDAVGLDGADTIDSVSDPRRAFFDFVSGGAGTDGFNVKLADDVSACFEMDLPTNATVQYGPFRTPLNAPLDLKSGGTCDIDLIEVSVPDVVVSEAAGQVDFDIMLSAPSLEIVTVDVMTVDGTAVSGSDFLALPTTTVTFNPGETEKSVSVSIVDDLVGEETESFALALSNPTGSTLGALSAGASITDDELSACGEPFFDPSAEQGIFIWQDCATDEWFLRMTSGGSPSVVIYNGAIVSNGAIQQVSPFSAESNDVIDATTDPLQVAFSLRMINSGVDGIDVVPAAGSSLCFELDAPASVLVGLNRNPVTPPFDMNTLQNCGGLLPAISVSSPSASEIDGQVEFQLTLSETSTSDVTVNVETIDGTATAGLDFSPIPSTTVTIAAGQLSQSVIVSLLDDSLAEGPEEFSLNLTAPTNATIAVASANATITDDEASPCGEPEIIAGSEAGVFLWRECGGDQWRMRVAGGGVYTVYEGSLVSSAPFAQADGFSIESADTVSLDAQGLGVDFDLRVSGAGQDGIDFRVADGANTCFSLDLPQSASVFLGQFKNPVSKSFDLDTLGACGGLPPAIGIADQSISEANGAIAVSITLSAPSQQAVTVDVRTVDGTALSGEDYLPLLETVTIPAGQTVYEVTLTLLDDAISEGSENFSLLLSNPLNSTLGNASAEITILDDEISPCGQPAYDSSTESGIFLWRDCPDGQWHMRISAGGVYSTYAGSISSSNGFSQISGFSIEPADNLDLTQPDAATYQLTVSGGGQDGIDFTPAAVSSTCFSVDLPAGLPVVVGAATSVLTPPFDLQTLASCGQLPALSISDASATEADTISFTVSLSVPSIDPVSVDYQTVDGTASALTDYTPSAGTVVIPAGSTSGTVDVSTNDDSTVEPNEEFSLLLLAPVAATLADDTGVGTIIDDDSISVSVNNANAAEVESGLVFTVALSAPSDFDVTVDYATGDQSATAGNDYVSLPLTTLSFAAGEISKQVTVPLLDDSDVEGDESLTLTLSNPIGANLGTDVGIGTISDDEPLPTLNISDASAIENGGFVEFLVTLTTPSTQPITVDFSTADGTASAGLDYLAAISETMTFDPGVVAKTIQIGIVEDALIESGEMFSLVLSNPTRAVIGTAVATGTILDNESVPSISISDITVKEDAGVASFEVVMTSASQVEVRVDFDTVADTATAPDDYAASSGTLVFDPGTISKSIDIALVDDNELEFAEVFAIVLSNAVEATIDITSASATIDDDEAVVCGEPPYDPAVDRLIVIWRDCLTTGEWHARMMVGSGYLSYSGRIESNQGFQSVSGFSLEANDLLETATDPSAIIYTLGMSAPGIDGVDFRVGDGATVCFNTSLGPGASVVAGANRTPVSGSSFDLHTLGPCKTLPVLTVANAAAVENEGTVTVSINLSAPSTRPISVDVASVDGSAVGGQDFVAVSQAVVINPGETTALVDVFLIDDADVEVDEEFSLFLSGAVNASFGTGKVDASATIALGDDEVATVFVVEDRVVAETDGAFDFDVTLTVAMTEIVTVDVRSVDAGAIEGLDYVGVPLTTLTFGIGETVKTVPLSLIDDARAEGPEEFTIELSAPTGVAIGKSTATISVTDDEPSPCGEPALDPATETGLFIWKNCVDGSWDVRFLAGPGFKLFTGRVSSSESFPSVGGFDIETSDIFDFSTDPSTVEFSLRVGAGYLDGFSFSPAPDATTCVLLDSPVATNAYLGTDKTLLTVPFDIDFLEVCAAP